MKKTVREQLWSGSLLAGIAALGVAAPAAAQTAQTTTEPAAPVASSAEIVVTGSRIKRPEFSGTIPGTQATAEGIEERGFTSVLDILTDMPIVGTGASFRGTNGGQPGSLGTSFVDILDLGTARTLTLVNGRRVVSSNAFTNFVSGNETGSQVDVAIIPVGLIDRIDVLTVGGSMAYGSDAVAGVVNYILKDDYEGMEVVVSAADAEEGGTEDKTARIVAGKNFLGDRGNITATFEWFRLDEMTGADREFIRNNSGLAGNFRNGSARNPAFPGANPRGALATGESAFFPTATDGIPTNIGIEFIRSGLSSDAGVIFANLNTTGSGALSSAFTGPSVMGVAQTGGLGTPAGLSGATQLIPGIPGTGRPAGSTGGGLLNANDVYFAPSVVPGTITDANRNAIFAALGITPAAGLSTSQLNALLLQALADSRPTQREFLAANPTLAEELYGSFIRTIPSIANTDTTCIEIEIPGYDRSCFALNTVLPRVGSPIQFDNGGNIVALNYGTIGADTDAVLGALAPGNNGYFRPEYTVLLPEIERKTFAAIGHFDFNENLRFIFEGLSSDTRTVFSNTDGSANSIASTGTENAVLMFSTANPFLDAADRTALAARNIGTIDGSGNVVTPGTFLLSRTNRDLVEGEETEALSKTERFLVGFEGSFEAFGRSFDWEITGSRGKADYSLERVQVYDTEFALAIDVADNGSGQIVCRSQLNPSAFIGTTPRGVGTDLTSVVGPDGIARQELNPPTITADQIARCVPLNPFGVNQMSQAAKDYVTYTSLTENFNTQEIIQGYISGELFRWAAGPIGFAVAAEQRWDSSELKTDRPSQVGVGRSAAFGNSSGESSAIEYGFELNIPVFGQDFRLPLFNAFEITGGLRWVELDAKAPPLRLLPPAGSPSGTLGPILNREYRGDTEQVSSIGFNWSPFESDEIIFRGNLARSVRQPSLPELFLSGQPIFFAPGQACTNTAITQSANPSIRRANCRALAIQTAANNTANPGFMAPTRTAPAVSVQNAAEADNFFNSLAGFTANIQGVRFGNINLRPEKAESYTVGTVIQPDFIEGLRISVDYLNIRIDDVLSLLAGAQAYTFCLDSPTFPDTTPQIGLNTCPLIRYDPRFFEPTDGVNVPFFNLPSQRVYAYTGAINYDRDLADLVSPFFDNPGDLGKIEVDVNVYHLQEFASSASAFRQTPSDVQRSDGQLGRPTWEVTSSLGYERGGFEANWSVQWTDDTFIRTGGTSGVQNIENSPYFKYPDYYVHFASVSYTFENDFKVQLNVDNVFNEFYIGGDTGQFQGARVDDIGRYYRVTASKRF